MGIFDKIFSRKSSGATATMAAPMPAPDADPECPHIVLTGRWDSVHDMGKDELATSFICSACRQVFTPEEARVLRETTAERIRIDDVDESQSMPAGT